MEKQENDDTAHALSDAGVPRHVIDYVARYQAIPFHRWLFALLVVAILIAGTKIAFYMLDRLEDATSANARALLRQSKVFCITTILVSGWHSDFSAFYLPILL